MGENVWELVGACPECGSPIFMWSLSDEKQDNPPVPVRTCSPVCNYAPLYKPKERKKETVSG